jgi:hypothetical protein
MQHLGSAGTASGASGTATTQAGIATTQAGFALTSAGNALTSETNANLAKVAAETAQGLAETAQGLAEDAQAAAELALDTFDDVYLGSKASDPTVDNDGDPLVSGALYYNTTTNALKVYKVSSWATLTDSDAGGLLASNNLSDLLDASVARTNLGLVQRLPQRLQPMLQRLKVHWLTQPFKRQMLAQQRLKT